MLKLKKKKKRVGVEGEIATVRSMELYIFGRRGNVLLRKRKVDSEAKTEQKYTLFNKNQS